MTLIDKNLAKGTPWALCEAFREIVVTRESREKYFGVVESRFDSLLHDSPPTVGPLNIVALNTCRVMVLTGSDPTSPHYASARQSILGGLESSDAMLLRLLFVAFRDEPCEVDLTFLALARFVDRFEPMTPSSNMTYASQVVPILLTADFGRARAAIPKESLVHTKGILEAGPTGSLPETQQRIARELELIDLALA